MKKISILFAILLIAVVSLFAQAPQKFSYQAVLRDAGNNLVTNHAVGVRISILQGGMNGSTVYMETQTVSTNANGLMTLQVGGGTVLSGDMSTIDWANGPFFLKTEADPTGGANYTIEGTQQLLSVPYALYAENAGNMSAISVTPTDTGYIMLLSSPDGSQQSFLVPEPFTQLPANWNESDSTSSQYIQHKPNLSSVATSGDYNDLANTPTIPDIANNAMLTIQKNGVSVGSFTANASDDVLINLTVPTSTSQLVNDAGFISAGQCENVDLCALTGVSTTAQS